MALATSTEPKVIRKLFSRRVKNWQKTVKKSKNWTFCEKSERSRLIKSFSHKLYIQKKPQFRKQ